MTILREVVDAIEQFAPLHYQEHYDNSGLLVGEMEQEISSVLLCVDIFEDTIQEAIERGCDMIVSHHPLVFSGLKQFSKSTYINRILHQAIKNNIAIYCSHTSLDSAYGGVSYRTASILGLKSLRALSPVSAEQPNIGLGVIGELKQPLALSDLLGVISDRLGCSVVRHSADDGRLIERVALCGGSGADLYPKANEQGADLYITGDIKYHSFFVESGSAIIADIGHFESENSAIDIFYDIISEKLPIFAVRTSLMDRNPVRYFIANK